MSYRSILVPVAQPDHAASALEAAFLVARRFAGHVCALHVLPDLADPATHALMATRMSLEAATKRLPEVQGRRRARVATSGRRAQTQVRGGGGTRRGADPGR